MVTVMEYVHRVPFLMKLRDASSSPCYQLMEITVSPKLTTGYYTPRAKRLAFYTLRPYAWLHVP